jgi:magnesium chelatase family protein
MSSREVRAHCQLDEVSSNLMRASINDLGLSARAHDKVLRVARTIADLDDCENIRPEHLSEAVNYRMLDRKLWQ